MEFRLYYDGPLYSASGEARDGQLDRRRQHKHELRKQFHGQLKHLWQSHPFLATSKSGKQVLGELSELPRDRQIDPFLWENIADRHSVGGHSFVPLVCEQFSLTCGVEILLLRSDRPGGIFNARDIDNRLKVIFDALRKPANEKELEGIEIDDDEKPMFVLLEDDSLISSVAVETDELLSPANGDDSEVRLTVSVSLKPYEVNMFNLSFA